MNIALGVNRAGFRVDEFLNANGRRNVTITTAADPGTDTSASLTFSSNPNRRHGEWLIRDQYSHRHPAWSAVSGFPTSYDHADRPYVLIFREGKTFHARFATESLLIGLGSSIVPGAMLSQQRGIAPTSTEFRNAFHVPPQSIIEKFEEQIDEQPDEEFNPADVSDGRKRVLAAVIRRLGQRAFRRKLLSAYGSRCAVKQDRGFRVFKLAQSNFKVWDSDAAKNPEALEKQLALHVDHLRDGRTPLDLLFEILLKSGYPLSARVEKLSLAHKEVFSVAAGALLVCLERDISLEAIRAIADQKPERVVCLDRGFAGNDHLKTNAVQTFKTKDIVFRTV
jgi:hypothetical protein